MVVVMRAHILRACLGLDPSYSVTRTSERHEMHFFDQMAQRNQGAFYHVSIFADAAKSRGLPTTVSAPTFSKIMKHFAHLKGAENFDPMTLV